MYVKSANVHPWNVPIKISLIEKRYVTMVNHGVFDTYFFSTQFWTLAQVIVQIFDTRYPKKQMTKMKDQIYFSNERHIVL